MLYSIRAIFTTMLAAGMLMGSAASSSAAHPSAKLPLKTVAHVNLKRYMGDWRVIANVPYFAENGCVDSIEGYRLRPDGRIDNFFTYRKGSFNAPQKQIHALGKVYNTRTNAEWRILFFGIVNAKYFITDLDPHYRWAVVAHPSRKYGWILARGRSLPESTYQGILKRLESQGYEASQFKKVPQFRSQLAGH